MNTQEAIKLLQEADAIITPLSLCTKLPFVVEDPETADDEILVYTSDTEAFAAQKKISETDPVRLLKIEGKNSPNFLATLFELGVNALKIHANGESTVVQLEELITRKPAEGVTPEMLPPENPTLMISLVYLFQEARKEKPNKEYVSEREPEMRKNIAEAEYIVPLAPAKDDSTKMLPLLMSLDPKQEQQWFPMFTSISEIHRLKLPENIKLNKMSFKQMNELMPKMNVAGCIINPGSIAVMLPKLQNNAENANADAADK
ncbi:MAG: SseB family protein [Eubacteriales bacterium]|nr:SseB family protein [Eubacteriales bacterium]